MWLCFYKQRHINRVTLTLDQPQGHLDRKSLALSSTRFTRTQVSQIACLSFQQ